MYDSLIDSLIEHYKITPRELFDRLAHAKNVKLKEDVFLKSSKCPREMFYKYKNYIRNSIISTCNSVDELYTHYESYHFDEKNLLNNPNCPEEIIERILERTNSLNTYFLIAKHVNSSAVILNRLWKLSFKEETYDQVEDYDELRKLIINNPNCSKKIIKTVLSNGSSNEWKIALLNSPYANKKVFESIFDSRYSFHSKRKDFNDSEIINISELERSLAGNKHCDKVHLKELVNDVCSPKYDYGDNKAEYLMAINSNVLHKKTLVELSTKDDLVLLRCLSLNKKCPSEALINIVNYDVTECDNYRNNFDIYNQEEAELITNVLNNPNCDKEVFKEVIDKISIRMNYHYDEVKDIALNHKYMDYELCKELLAVNIDQELGLKSEEVKEEKDPLRKFNEIKKEEKVIEEPKPLTVYAETEQFVEEGPSLTK